MWNSVQKETDVKLDGKSTKHIPQRHTGFLSQLYSLMIPTSWKSQGGGEGEGRRRLARLTPHPLAARLATISPDQVGGT